MLFKLWFCYLNFDFDCRAYFGLWIWNWLCILYFQYLFWTWIFKFWLCMYNVLDGIRIECVRKKIMCRNSCMSMEININEHVWQWKIYRIAWLLKPWEIIKNRHNCFCKSIFRPAGDETLHPCFSFRHLCNEPIMLSKNSSLARRNVDSLKVFKRRV
jgi:hypothetical protein